MRYLAAYLLCALGENKTPSADDVKKVLSSVGAEVDAEKLSLFLSKVEGKELDELIKEGEEKLVVLGGAAGGGAGGAAGGEAAAVEEKVEEEEEEVDVGGGALFGDDDGGY